MSLFIPHLPFPVDEEGNVCDFFILLHYLFNYPIRLQIKVHFKIMTKQFTYSKLYCHQAWISHTYHLIYSLTTTVCAISQPGYMVRITSKDFILKFTWGTDITPCVSRTQLNKGLEAHTQTHTYLYAQYKNGFCIPLVSQNISLNSFNVILWEGSLLQSITKYRI